MKVDSRPTWKGSVFDGNHVTFLLYMVELLMGKYKVLLADIQAINNARVNTLIFQLILKCSFNFSNYSRYS